MKRSERPENEAPDADHEATAEGWRAIMVAANRIAVDAVQVVDSTGETT